MRVQKNVNKDGCWKSRNKLWLLKGKLPKVYRTDYSWTAITEWTEYDLKLLIYKFLTRSSAQTTNPHFVTHIEWWQASNSLAPKKRETKRKKTENQELTFSTYWESFSLSVSWVIEWSDTLFSISESSPVVRLFFDTCACAIRFRTSYKAFAALGIYLSAQINLVLVDAWTIRIQRSP